MKTPTQEEVEEDLRCLEDPAENSACNAMGRRLRAALEAKDKEIDLRLSEAIKYSNEARLNKESANWYKEHAAALEANAHSEADCLRVAAECLKDAELWSPYLESHQPLFVDALRAEADRREDRAAFDEAADQLAAKYGLPPSGCSDAQKTE